jgi:hypothetical protein
MDVLRMEPLSKDLTVSVTKNMALKFCPSCGGNTLLRTSTSTNANGEVQIHLKKNMQWTNRGTKVLPPAYLSSFEK